MSTGGGGGGGKQKENSGGAGDSWNSVTEETLLLHDDLLRLVDHIPLPSRVSTGTTTSGGTVDDDYGLPVLDGKTPNELAEIISRECGIKTTTYTSLMEYRLNALRGLWAWLKSREKKSSLKKSEETTSAVKPTPKGEGFSSRISLVLIFPILHSLSKVDPNLSCETAKILLDSLCNCEPVSLSKEPLDCILGLENLLCSWLTNVKEQGEECNVSQVQTAASALVALAVAVGTGGLLLRTVHTLQSLDSTHQNLTLSVPNVLHKLLKEHLNVEEPSVIVNESHINCWSYQHQNVSGDEVCPRSIAYCGKHVYLTTSKGKSLLKLGTGLCGTLRGYIYTSIDIEEGWLIQCQGILLYRKKSFDDEAQATGPFCIKFDDFLKECGTVTCTTEFTPPTDAYSTVHLMSDGLRVYWVYVMKGQEVVTTTGGGGGGGGGDKNKHHRVYLQVFEFNATDLTLTPLNTRLLLQRNGGTDDKGGSDVMKALMRAGSSYSSSFSAALLGGAKDDPATSCGLGLKQLKNSSAYCTGSSLIFITSPPTSTSGRSLFGSVTSATGKALCVSFGYNLSTGTLVSQAELSPTSSLQCGLSKGGSIQSLAASYDSRNHCVWTVCDDWIDIWTCVGRVRPAAHSLAIRMGQPSQDILIPITTDDTSTTNSIHVQEAITLLLRHSGMESCRLTPGRDFGSPISHNLSLNFLTHCCNILQYCVRCGQDENALTCIITLQAVLPSFLSSTKHSSEEISKLVERVRMSCWELINKEECSTVILVETYRLISQNCERLYLSDTHQSQTLLSLLSSSIPGSLATLRNDIFIEIAKELHPLSLLPSSLSKLTQLLVLTVEQDIAYTLEQLKEGGVSVVLATQPEFSPALQCCSAMLNVNLRSLSSCVCELKQLVDKKSIEELTSVEEKRKELEAIVEANRQSLVDLCRDLKLFELCDKFLSGLCEISSTISHSLSNDSTSSNEGEGEEEKDSTPSQKKQQLILALERSSKGGVLGCLLPPLLAMMSDPNMCDLSLANTVLPHITDLGKKTAQCCTAIYTDYSNITIPAPWASGRLIETIHPVRDNYKFKETVSFPGARHLYLKFDTRCSSQYDYDKVQVFSGDSPSSTKVAEYGGNTHGFGSRSVLGKGWPKELVKVDGDTVTFTFEMKSGREHSTPDKAMWGFSCTVRPQEMAEDSPTGLPFLLDLYLSISSISCSLISQLFDGAPPTVNEVECESLMESLLLQRCVWPDNEEGVGGVVRHTHRKPLQSNVLHKLRSLACRPRPVLRLTISELLQIDLLEDLIVSTCLKHKGAESIFSYVLSGELSEKDRCLLEEIFNKINGLERRLQALVELETKWFSDVEDISNDCKDITGAFFYELQQQESTVKQFDLLCCLMSIDQSVDTFSSVKQLQELMEKDVQRRKDQKDLEIDVHSKTRSIVGGVLDRAQLLLQVNISSSSPAPSPILRSMSVPASHLVSPSSISRQRSDGSSLLVDTLSEGAEQSLLDEIFQFIGTKPEEAVSCDSFLIAASQQRKRGIDRVRALEFLRSVLTSPHLPTSIEHLLACVGGVLRNGPCVKDIACSGRVIEVRSAFADVMQAVVELASKQPSQCINTIALLSIVPYTREEESCLVRSGLVKLLDHLCSMSDMPQSTNGGEEGGGGGGGEEESEAVLRVTTLAWAAFQVLADRCVSWETKSIGFISSGLAQQVSLLLTNHLSRAMDTLVTSESGSSETLQEALSMLLGLARSYMGRTILSQPACVSKLLLLLTDQRPSPKLVLIALQLCRIALPLMTIAECSQVIIPNHPTLSSLPQSTNLASKIITLLMAKLAEYMTPSHTPLRNQQEMADTPTEETISLVLPSQQDEIDESGQASVYVYRRDSESAAEILHLLLNQDPRQLAHRMETVLRLDQSLTDEGKAEILTDTYRVCFRRSIRWANMGFTVSIEPPAGTSSEPSGTESDRKRAKAESSCKKKNLELLKTDPPRPFLSGTVAYSLASEIIGLLNGLLADHDAAQVWRNAIQEVIQCSLESVPRTLPKLEHYCNLVHQALERCEAPPTPDKHLLTASLANACFAALGGFKDTLRPGMKVEILGEGVAQSFGTINSISEQRGVAHVQFDDKYCFGVNQTLEVPLSRLLPPQVGSLPLQQLELDRHLCLALISVLSTSSLFISNPHTGMDASLEGMSFCRLFTELRTRACMCLSHQIVKEKEFKKLFLSECDLHQLKRQIDLVQPGQRLSVVEGHCMSLRMLYRDCSRPSAPRIERPRIERKRFYLDIKRSWPVISYCSFSHHLTSLVYQGATTSTGAVTTTSAGSEEGGGEGGGGGGQDKPKGAYIVTNNPIPSHAPSFYWEIDINQLDAGSSAPHLTFGFCPGPVKPPEGGVWSYPEETCLFRNTGRGFQVQGDDRMKWNKISIESPLKTGDTVGCGWLREEPPTLKGVVYFTVNGTRLEQTFKDCPPGLYPFIHVQKKGIRLKLNFGDYCFAYQEGHAHRDAADVNLGESLEEIMALFKELPFAYYSDSEDDEVDDEPFIIKRKKKKIIPTITKEEGESFKPEPLTVGPPCNVLKPPTVSEAYDTKSSSLYFSHSSFDGMLESGPLVRPGGGANHEEEDLDEGGGGGGGGGSGQDEDLHSLLVKSWEAKVFPLITRRFRNDQERKSGLDQIRGALQLGMESIAQETVEFLYEENGGLPQDLHFPTMDDVKADLDKFTISRVKKGSAVVVQKELPYSRCGVRAMQKTQGLTGIVLSVDEVNELVQVECYIPSDGALVRFWYPVVYLERPPKGYRKPSALRGAESVNILVHRELLNCESILTAIYCRSALLSLHSLSSPLSFSDYFTLLSQHYFSQPSVEGTCLTTSPSLSPLLSSCLPPSLHSLFFSNHKLIEKELLSHLQTNPSDALPLVVKLSESVSQMGGVCGRGEFDIPEGREGTDVYCPEASFMIVSSVEVKPGSKSSSSYKYPWAKVFTYRGGQGKAGRMLLQEVSRYPNETQTSVNPQYCGDLFPSLILPVDRVYLKLTGSTPPPGQRLVIHGVPTLLPVLLNVANTLSVNCTNIEALSSCLSPLIKILSSTDWPLSLKLKLNQSIANILWTLIDLGASTSLVSFPPDLLSSLNQELEQLYESECESFLVTNSNGEKVKPKGPPFPPSTSIGGGGAGRFSTYFQSLLELVLAGRNYTQCHAPPEATPPSTNGKKKGKKLNWLNYVQRAVELLLAVSKGRNINDEFYRCFYKSLPSRPHSCLLVVTGISPGLVGTVAVETIKKICRGYGGGVVDLFVPLREKTKEEKEKEKKEDKKEIEKKESSNDEATSDTPQPADDKTTPSSEEQATPTTDEQQATPTNNEPEMVVQGGAVIRLKSGGKTSMLSTSLLASRILQGEGNSLSVLAVSDTLKCGEDETATEILNSYLKGLLYDENDRLKEDPRAIFSDIFKSAKLEKVYQKSLTGEQSIECMLKQFIQGTSPGGPLKDTLNNLWEKEFGGGVDSPLTEDVFMKWIEKEGVNNCSLIWCGLLGAGYDLTLKRCGFLPSEAKSCCTLNSALDSALVLHVDTTCRLLDVTSSLLHPWELDVSDAELTSKYMLPLQGLTISDIRMRFIALKNINRQISWLLPLLNLNTTHPHSLGSLLSSLSSYLFYDRKTMFLHTVLNSATRRSVDQAPPEIKMDPLENVGGLPSTVLGTQFCQAARQMLTVPSPQLCVPLASGGDPTYAFNVKLSGEEVHGTSGSFRHFLWQVVKELQSPLLPVLMQCPSSATGINKGKHILTTGPMSYSEEKLLVFFGQLLGVAIRADVPAALDLLPSFWKCLKGDILTMDDLKEIDHVTHTYTKNIIEAKDEISFNELLTQDDVGTDTNTSTDTTSTQTDSNTIDKETDSSTSTGTGLRFTYTNLKGEIEELEENGNDRVVNYGNRLEYAEAIRQFRLQELQSLDRYRAVRCGLASVIPLEVLKVFTSNDLDLRVCGLPHVDLQYLKSHTTYHVGLMESDRHIQYFWTALETLSQEELRKFIKFACNQERIPFGHPCRGGEVTNVPPYPMKIAPPPDGQGSPDSRYIRAETCMFLIKLPQYSTQETMTERLKYAINCREDPLSG